MKLTELRRKTEDGVFAAADFAELVHGTSPRQLCLADGAALEEARGFNGLCTARFNAELITEGLDYAELKAGSRLFVGGAELEITEAGKRCFDECPLRQAGESCPLPRSCAFARVVTGAVVRAGMTIIGA